MVGGPTHRIYVYDKINGQIIKSVNFYPGFSDNVTEYIKFSVSDGELVVTIKRKDYSETTSLRTGLPLSAEMSEEIVVTIPPHVDIPAKFIVY